MAEHRQYLTTEDVAELVSFQLPPSSFDYKAIKQPIDRSICHCQHSPLPPQQTFIKPLYYPPPPPPPSTIKTPFSLPMINNNAPSHHHHLLMLQRMQQLTTSIQQMPLHPPVSMNKSSVPST